MTRLPTVASVALALFPCLPLRASSRAADSVRELEAQLADPDPLTRRCAALSLALLGAHAAAATSALIRALDDTSDGLRFTVRSGDVRADAVRALGRIGPSSVPDLEAALAGRVRTRAIGAALALARLGRAARDAAGTLRERLHDRDDEVAFAAALALTAVDPPALDALPVLASGISNAVFDAITPDPRDRTIDLAFAALEAVGPPAVPVVALFREHPVGAVRDRANGVVASTPTNDGRDDATAALATPSRILRLEAIEDLLDRRVDLDAQEGPRWRDAIARALAAPEHSTLAPSAGMPGAAQQDVVAWMAVSNRRRRRDPDDSLERRETKRAELLDRLRGCSHEELAAAIVPRLADPQPEVRTDAARLWLQLFPDDERGARTLADCLDEKSEASASSVLREYGGRRMKVRVLEQTLDAGVDARRQAMAEALLAIDGGNAAAIAALVGLTESKDRNVAKDAIDRLAALGDRPLEPAVASEFRAWFDREDGPLQRRLQVLEAWTRTDQVARPLEAPLVGGATRFLERCCASDEIETTVSAAEILDARAPESPAPLQGLLRTLAHAEDASGRDLAARAFSSLGEKALTALLAMAADRSATPIDRQWAAYAIGGMAGANARAVATLLASDDVDVRRWVLEGIKRWNDGEKRRRIQAVRRGTPPPPSETEANDRRATLREVEPLLNRPERLPRAAAAVAVLMLDCSARSWPYALEELLLLLDRSDTADVGVVAEHLGEFGSRLFSHEPGTPGEADRATCEALEKQLCDALEHRARDAARPLPQRHAAARALALVGGTVERVAALIRSDDLPTAIAGVWALRFTDDESAATGRLVDALEDPRGWIRANGADSLLHLGREVQRAKSSLSGLANDPDPEIAKWCRDLLAKTQREESGR